MYLEIEKFRFQDRFGYEIIIKDEDCLKSLLPKMSIEQLIENACKHGIQKSFVGGKVMIVVEMDGEYVKFNISDNGAGISSERLKEITIGLDEPTATSNCVGLRNVYQRLKLYYNNDYEFEIIGKEGIGTTIEFKIPNWK